MAGSLVLFVAAVHSVRMLTLFSFTPLVRYFVTEHDPLLSLVLASYPLMQAIGQLPFGQLSDRFGRLKLIRIGLIGFVIGGCICYFFPNPYGLIIGRGLQGGCAVGAPAGALLNDRSRSSSDLQSQYYLIGLGIVISMALSFIIAPQAELFGFMRELFLFNSMLALILFCTTFRMREERKTIESSEKHSFYDFRSVLIGLFRKRTSRFILCSNFLIHFLQAYLIAMIPDYAFQKNFGVLSHQSYPYAFFIALVIASIPLKSRSWLMSFRWSFWGAVLLGMAAFFSVVLSSPLFKLSVGLFQLIGIFYLLLLLESALPVALKHYVPSNQGTTVGLSNTVQYAAMALGSFFVYPSQSVLILLPLTLIVSFAILSLSLGTLIRVESKLFMPQLLSFSQNNLEMRDRSQV